MLGERYVVTKGDSLWRIAERKLGSGTQWPRIWKYNNRPEVSRVTGRTIPNPDLIYIGQVLLIPTVPGMKKPALPAGTPPSPHIEAQPEHGTPLSNRKEAPHARPALPMPKGGGGTTLSDRLHDQMSPIAIKYKLEDIPFPPRDIGNAIIEVKMTGDVILMTKKQYPVVYVTSRREIELQVTREANHAFGQLIDDSRFIYDSRKKQFTLRCLLVSQSNVPNSFATAIGVEMNTSTLTPKLRAEIRLPKLQGSLAPFDYVAMDVKVVIEITPKFQPPTAPGSPLIESMRREVKPQPVRVAPAPGTDWNKVIGVGIVVFAGLVVVGTLVEDFFTAGAGTADDPASFALASVAFRRGMAMLAGSAVTLPQASVAASVQQKNTVTLDGGRVQ